MEMERIVATILIGVMATEGLGLYRLFSRRLQLLREWGYGKPAPLTGYMLGLLVATAYCTAAIWSNPRILVWVFQPSLLKLIAIMAALAAGFLEEILFRGAIMTVLKKAGWSTPLQILASGAAFGLVHAAWGIPSGQFVGPMAATAALGWASALVYIASNRSLGPVIACHVLVDVILEPGLLMTAVSGH